MALYGGIWLDSWVYANLPAPGVGVDDMGIAPLFTSYTTLPNTGAPGLSCQVKIVPPSNPIDVVCA